MGFSKELNPESARENGTGETLRAAELVRREKAFPCLKSPRLKMWPSQWAPALRGDARGTGASGWAGARGSGLFPYRARGLLHAPGNAPAISEARSHPGNLSKTAGKGQLGPGAGIPRSSAGGLVAPGRGTPQTCSPGSPWEAGAIPIASCKCSRSLAARTEAAIAAGLTCVWDITVSSCLVKLLQYKWTSWY